MMYFSIFDSSFGPFETTLDANVKVVYFNFLKENVTPGRAQHHPRIRRGGIRRTRDQPLVQGDCRKQKSNLQIYFLIIDISPHFTFSLTKYIAFQPRYCSDIVYTV